MTPEELGLLEADKLVSDCNALRAELLCQARARGARNREDGYIMEDFDDTIKELAARLRPLQIELKGALEDEWEGFPKSPEDLTVKYLDALAGVAPWWRALPINENYDTYDLADLHRLLERRYGLARGEILMAAHITEDQMGAIEWGDEPAPEEYWRVLESFCAPGNKFGVDPCGRAHIARLKNQAAHYGGKVHHGPI